MNISSRTSIRCEGWWEQSGYGRQPMLELTIVIEDGNLRGQGRDIIGPFTLTGQIVREQVAILKRYIGQHSVEYYGAYDGEGTLAGKWEIGDFRGNWLIKFVREKGNADAAREIQELM
jgi:hypothetical protein